MGKSRTDSNIYTSGNNMREHECLVTREYNMSITIAVKQGAPYLKQVCEKDILINREGQPRGQAFSKTCFAGNGF